MKVWFRKFNELPNPFSDFTRIHFEHNRQMINWMFDLDIYDMNGKRIKSVSQSISSGSYANSDFTWDGRSDQGAALNSGIYISRYYII